MEKKYWALIPVKSKSQRVPEKNVKILNKHPLFAWTINIALLSGIYDKVIVCTESSVIADDAMLYGADVFRRSIETTKDDSPDILWIYELFSSLKSKFELPDAFSILRVTSPFRTVDMLKKAHTLFEVSDCDSLRAVEPLDINLHKVWVVDQNRYMHPFVGGYTKVNDFLVPYHSYPTQFAPKSKLFKQNASLEISYVKNILEKRSISGDKIIPFYTDEFEGFDINTLGDWDDAEILVNIGKVSMQEIVYGKGGVLLNP